MPTWYILRDSGFYKEFIYIQILKKYSYIYKYNIKHGDEVPHVQVYLECSDLCDFRDFSLFEQWKILEIT
jgi:hypothetical protein